MIVMVILTILTLEFTLTAFLGTTTSNCHPDAPKVQVTYIRLPDAGWERVQLDCKICPNMMETRGSCPTKI